MSQDTTDVGSFAIVYVVDNGGRYHVDASHWDEITAAYSHWIERKIDRMLTLTGNDGSDIILAASRISDATLSTPEGRERSRTIDAALKSEGGFTDE